MSTPLPVPAALDHLVFAGPDLDDLVAWFADQTGVRAVPGGRHPSGTINALVGLEAEHGDRHYLELLAPDPHREEQALPTTFGVDRLGGPRLVTWAIHPDHPDAVIQRARLAGYDPGDLAPKSRLTPAGTLLEWRLTPAVGVADPVLPFVIDWGTSKHPATETLPTLRLEALEAQHPDAVAAARALELLGAPLAVTQAEAPDLTAVLSGPAGTVRLG